MNWKTIKENIIQYLTNNPEGKLKLPERRLRELEKIEKLLGQEYLHNPTKLLSIDKNDLIKELNIKNSAAASIINNIYDILNNKPLQSKRKNNE